MALLPHYNRSAPGEVAHVDPRRKLWVAMRQHMRPVGRIDRKIVDRELGAAGIDEWRSKSLMPGAGDRLGHRPARKLCRLRPVAQERLTDLGHQIDRRKRDERGECASREMAQPRRLLDGPQP